MDKQVNINIGRRRRWLGITQAALAKTMRASQPYLSDIEKGKVRVSTNMLIRLAEALNVTPVELATGSWVKVQGGE